jgi:ABC-2 type transport system permease protein
MIGLRQFTLTELRLFLREPTQIIFGMGLPILLLVLFGFWPVMTKRHPEPDGLRALDIYIPILIGVCMTQLGLSSLTSSLSSYREKRILRRLATTPAQPMALLLAQLAVHMIMILVAVILLIVIGILAFEIRIPGNIIGFLIAFLLSASSIFAIGLFVAAVAPNAKAGTLIGTLLFFPILFFAGLWTPGPMMPELIRRVATFTPLGAGCQAMQAAWDGSWPPLLQLAVLAVYTVGGCLLASKLFRWS